MLRGSPVVRPATRQRVQEAISALNYVYDRGAARMRGKHSRTVGVVIVDLTSSFFAELLAGVDAALDRAGLIAFVANTGEDIARQARVLARFREQAVDGVIICPAAGAAPDLLLGPLRNALPCVQALRRVAGAGTDFVGADNRLGMRMATEHLITYGHRAIAFVGAGAHTSVAREREAGYLDAMGAAGLAPRLLACPNTRAAAHGAAGAALAGPAAPTGFVCFNDPTAMGAMLAVHQTGLVPGADVAVVGFDGIEDSALTYPALSTVAIRPVALGEAAAEQLLARIAVPGGAPAEIIIAPTLVVRASSGPPRGRVRS